MITGKIHGVSLGTGDADLITLKGLKTLQQADKIYYPGSLFKDGRKVSYSRTILNNYNLDTQKLVGFYLKMDLERVQAKEVYETTFQQILSDSKNGLSIAIVSEGDISTYSSFSYLLEKIKTHQLKIDLIPGITSYLHLSSESQIPLCLQNEKVTVIPRIQSKQELQEAIDNFDTVVLMKIISVVDIITAVIDTQKHSVTYAERLGTDEQFITNNWNTASKRETPYFSLIIIKKIKK
ncbi:precorrin-2 C(20)-methyltransferase [Tenacibaculum finnmarkense]|uniref:precorrin-2 C(20)-methyltransferase n=1 Tax=Tenacibaculum finnmarkense TaxID=2781243 RepID=UPI00187B8F2E|nr:precorrin-2 C(20)-methyltransferase [Tenacibaculum finnmarkense]MBE7692569.1 precorrin-2 C(20)-methyltransferase [Tenacibaculum finnmarkense genomovar finnmarkense]